MKISEYMNKLEQILHEYGDLDIIESYIENSSLDEPPEYGYNMNPAPNFVDQSELPEDMREEGLPEMYVEVS